MVGDGPVASGGVGSGEVVEMRVIPLCYSVLYL